MFLYEFLIKEKGFSREDALETCTRYNEGYYIPFRVLLIIREFYDKYDWDSPYYPKCFVSRDAIHH